MGTTSTHPQGRRGGTRTADECRKGSLDPKKTSCFPESLLYSVPERPSDVPRTRHYRCPEGRVSLVTLPGFLHFSEGLSTGVWGVPGRDSTQPTPPPVGCNGTSVEVRHGRRARRGGARTPHLCRHSFPWVGSGPEEPGRRDSPTRAQGGPWGSSLTGSLGQPTTRGITDSPHSRTAEVALEAYLHTRTPGAGHL